MSSRRTKVYASAYKTEPHYADMEKDEAITFSVDWNGVLNSFSSAATISTSSWAQDTDAVITISGAASSSGVTSALFTAAIEGKTVITNTVVLSNGEKREQKLAMQVLDSRCY